MAEERKKKVSFMLPKAEVASFFRKLGEDLQAGGVGEVGLDLDGCCKLSVSMKNKGEAYRVRLKVKLPRPEDAPLARISGLEDLVEPESEPEESGQESGLESRPEFKPESGLKSGPESVSAAELGPEGAAQAGREAGPGVEKDRPAASELGAPGAGADARTTKQDLASDVDEAAKPRYKSLKKRMGRSFKSVAASLADGQAPVMADLEAFVADSRLMCSYPGLGDEFYPAYLELVGRLAALVGQGDAESLREALSTVWELNQMKKDCHARYK